MSEPNGRYLWLKILLPLATVAGAALTSHVTLKGDVAHIEQELPRIETRTDAKLAQQRELILAELRAINGRLERIERRLP